KKQARVTVKQTQAGEPFHFPLALAFVCPPASQPTRVEQEITEKEHTFTIPLAGPPSLVEVDPDQAVLAEIKETKGRDQWRGPPPGGARGVSRSPAGPPQAPSSPPTQPGRPPAPGVPPTHPPPRPEPLAPPPRPPTVSE